MQNFFCCEFVCRIDLKEVNLQTCVIALVAILPWIYFLLPNHLLLGAHWRMIKLITQSPCKSYYLKWRSKRNAKYYSDILEENKMYPLDCITALRYGRRECLLLIHI